MEERKESTLEEIREGLEKMEKITKGRAILDFFQSKIISRKFMVFIIATVFLCLKMINSEHWVMISGAYLGTNVLEQFSNVWKDKGAKEE